MAAGRAGIILACLVVLVSAMAEAQNTVKLSGNHPTTIPGKPAGPIDPRRTLSMSVTLGLRDAQGLQRLLSEQQDPGSPNYRRWLTPQEFASHFGPDPAQFNAVRDWLVEQGFEIESASLQRRSIQFKGSAELAERVFETRIESYGGGAYANLTDPSIPARFAGVIAAISGLDNIAHAVPLTNRPKL